MSQFKFILAITGPTLPTEAQWEYGCRAGTETVFSFESGDSCIDGACIDPCPERDAYMWYCITAERRTHEIGTKLPNLFGLHDMHGNVSEWCEDVFDADFYSKPEAAMPNPVCTSDSNRQVLRGGSWNYDAERCPSAGPRKNRPSFRCYNLGFRVSDPLQE